MTIRLSPLILLCLILAVTPSAHASDRCPELFGTGDLLAYLSSLLENQIMGEEELTRLIQGLEKGQRINPISLEKTLVNSAALLHARAIQDYFDGTQIDEVTLLNWAKKNLADRHGIKLRRLEVQVETQSNFQKIEFFPIPPGSFEMGDVKKVPVTLTHTIEMMSTVVTQNQWVELMGENSSEIISGEQSIVVPMAGKLIRMLPNNPVENMTWWSTLVFANKLSEMHGLEPAYDFSNVTWEGNASRGTLTTRDEVKINAPNGDIYLTEGYRLPTEAEQEYVRKNLGRVQTRYVWGSNESDANYYAWYLQNSGGRTRPVAMLQPLVIGKREFYDLFGNVWEWSGDCFSGSFEGGQNPFVYNSFNAAHRGGCCVQDAWHCGTAVRYANSRLARASVKGFRLVRTLR